MNRVARFGNLAEDPIGTRWRMHRCFELANRLQIQFDGRAPEVALPQGLFGWQFSGFQVKNCANKRRCKVG